MSGEVTATVAGWPLLTGSSTTIATDTWPLTCHDPTPIRSLISSLRPCREVTPAVQGRRRTRGVGGMGGLDSSSRVSLVLAACHLAYMHNTHTNICLLSWPSAILPSHTTHKKVSMQWENVCLLSCNNKQTQNFHVSHNKKRIIYHSSESAVLLVIKLFTTDKIIYCWILFFSFYWQIHYFYCWNHLFCWCAKWVPKNNNVKKNSHAQRKIKCKHIRRDHPDC
jgi:hypothetical protein